MATLYKRPRSPYWWITYQDKGKTVRRSTNVRHHDALSPPKKGEAARILRDTETKLGRQRLGLSIDPTDHDLLKWYQTFSQWYLTNKRPTASTWTYRQKANAAFLDFCQGHDIEKLSQVTPSVLREYYAGRQIADKTRVNDISWWRQVWERAKIENLIAFDRNPWDFFLPAKVESASRRALTDEECKILLAVTKPPWRRFALWLGYYTGERYSAILHLRTEDVQGDVIAFHRTKQDRVRYVYIPRPLKAFLAAYTPHGKTFLAPSVIQSEADGEGSGMYRLFQILRRDHSGLFIGASYHCLRHTFVSRLANAGVSRSERMEIVDHTTDSAHSRYTHEEAARALSFRSTLDKVFS